MAKKNQSAPGGAINYKKKRQYAPGNTAEAGKKFQLTMYYKVAGGYTLVCGILYAALRVIYSKGYLLINTSIQYWLWYALVIGLILVLGRYISDMPKNPTTRKAVKICTSIVTICLLLLLYVQAIDMIDNNFNKYAEVTSADGSKTAIVMRANLNTAAAAEEEMPEEEGTEYTLYKAYPKLNKFFCDGRNAEDMIWLKDDPDALLTPEWSEDGKSLTITTNGQVMTVTDDVGTGESTVYDTIVVNFE